MILEEGTTHWPTDTRFLRPLAILYATLGRGYEAIQMLQRYIAADGRSDADALYLGVEWIYQIHTKGATLHGRVEDVRLARSYADQYAKANGPKQALVKQWVDYLGNVER